MKCFPVWIAGIALLVGPIGPASAQRDEQPDVYRVELIVVEHVDGRSDLRPAQLPLDFSATPNPITSRARLEQANSLQQRALGSSLGTSDPSNGRRHWLENDDERIEPAPTLWTAPDEPSAAMQQAWQQLAQSGDFEPLSWTGWFQTAPPRRSGRSQRVHDDRIVQSQAPVGPSRPLMHPDLTFVDELWAPDMPPVLRRLFGSPSPTAALYRVDGEVSLRQRRFLHLDLNLVWQQPADPPEAVLDTSFLAEVPEQVVQPPEKLSETAPWRLHRLRDSRAIRPGRFEYFDSSRFGVLARVTLFDQKIVEPEPAPEPAPIAEPATTTAGPTPTTDPNPPQRPGDVPDAPGRYH